MRVKQYSSEGIMITCSSYRENMQGSSIHNIRDNKLSIVMNARARHLSPFDYIRQYQGEVIMLNLQ